VYDARRPKEALNAPPSARLTERYGSWPRARRAAWGLLEDGRYFGDAHPWPNQAKRRHVYTVDEAAASVRECAAAVGRIPSSFVYLHWGINRRARARASGESCRIAGHQTVLRLLAPDRSKGNGWRLVVERVFPHGFSAR